MNIYENQRKIAIIVLVPIILLLLLSLHFKIWSGRRFGKCCRTSDGSL